MHYLRLAADYGDSPPLVSEFDSYISLPNDLISAGLWKKLGLWNEDYQVVMPLNMRQRNEEAVRLLIEDLDGRGIELARLVEEELGEAKVSYFSEGLLKKFPPKAE